MQDAVERALSRWPVEGVPDNAGGMADHRRRGTARSTSCAGAATERAKLQEVAADGRACAGGPSSLRDDLLRLIFTCCHPALPIESRVALTLRTVAGLSTAEIARAFLVAEATMSQRLLRAKGKIAQRRHPLPGAGAGAGWRSGPVACSRCSTSSSTRATAARRATSRPRRCGCAGCWST